MGRSATRRLTGNKAALVGGALVLFVAFLALAAPLLAGNPIRPDVDHGITLLGAPLPPGGDYGLGTDGLGRSVWARLVYGARVSLMVGALATVIALSVGVLIGLCAGYFGGWVDTLLMRFTDLVLSFPFLLLAVALASAARAAGTGSGVGGVLLVLGLVGWTTMARVVRSKVLTLRELEFVQAARAVGAGARRVLWRHLLPNLVGPIAVLATLGVAQMILAESTLSFLGLGAPPPTPTWGRMLYEGQAYYRTAPHLLIAPGVALLLTVLGFNLLGEGLRDAFDPRDKS